MMARSKMNNYHSYRLHFIYLLTLHVPYFVLRRCCRSPFVLAQVKFFSSFSLLGSKVLSRGTFHRPQKGNSVFFSPSSFRSLRWSCWMAVRRRLPVQQRLMSPNHHHHHPLRRRSDSLVSCGVEIDLQNDTRSWWMVV